MARARAAACIACRVHHATRWQVRLPRGLARSGSDPGCSAIPDSTAGLLQLCTERFARTADKRKLRHPVVSKSRQTKSARDAGTDKLGPADRGEGLRRYGQLRRSYRPQEQLKCSAVCDGRRRLPVIRHAAAASAGTPSLMTWVEDFFWPSHGALSSAGLQGDAAIPKVRHGQHRTRRCARTSWR